VETFKSTRNIFLIKEKKVERGQERTLRGEKKGMKKGLKRTSKGRDGIKYRFAQAKLSRCEDVKKIRSGGVVKNRENTKWKVELVSEKKNPNDGDTEGGGRENLKG